MRHVLVVLVLGCAAAASACSGAGMASQASAVAEAAPVLLTETPEAPRVGDVAPEAARVEPPPLDCSPTAMQGGAIICLAMPGGALKLDGVTVAVADASGVAVIGLSIKQQTPAIIAYSGPIGSPFLDTAALPSLSIPVTARTDAVSRFTMECGKIAPRSKADQRKADVSWVKKAEALKVFSDPVAAIGFRKPADGPYSSPFGVTRTYVPRTRDCEGSTSVHNGQDIAIPTGTIVTAPMAGTVILADPDLFFEGGCVFLDHGRGLVSVLMHLSRIDVKAGDVIGQGDPIGLSGATGRVTGPHLHWAIKFRNVTSTDRGTDIWLDPALLLELAGPAASAVSSQGGGE